jgi:glucuronoarabinoxylan endo-1,4-beta-xylanase
VIDLNTKYQSISGFGASSAWNTLTTSDYDLLWDIDKGAGLSLLRLRIDPTATTTSTSNANQLTYAKAAAAKGVVIWASPWSPVSAWQTNYGTDGSGNAKLKFNFAYGTQWANLLASFAKDVKAMGIPLYAISAQNEPDGSNFNHFEAADIVTWIKTYLGPAMAGTGVKIIAPETVNWCGFSTYEPAILNDATAASFVPILATHEYGCSPKAYPAIQAANKEFWETEIYESDTSSDQGIGSGLNTAKLMHEALTISNVNAWHYWWVHGGSNTGLFPNGSSMPSKRLWVMGNYSKFVRPGYVRIGAPIAPTSGVTVSAYFGATDRRVVIVAINTNAAATSRVFGISGLAPSKITPWLTDATNDLKAQSPLPQSGNVFTYALPPKSVTSIVIDG